MSTPAEPNIIAENARLSLRLQLAHAFVGLVSKGFDALLHHGINYQTLPEYRDREALDKATSKPISEARSGILAWIERVSHGIDAAIRRKQFRKV